MTVNKKGQTIIPESFERIRLKDLLPGDILLYINGNKLTEWHGKNRLKKYGRSTLPPYHAGILFDLDEDDGRVWILDQELQGNFGLIEEYTSKMNLRIDVIRPIVPSEVRKAVQKTIEEIGKKEKLYDWKGYFAFLSQMPFLQWAKIIKPSDNTFYCSDVVAYVWQVNNVQISPRDHDYTAPVDLQIFSIKHQETLQCFTLKLKGETI